MKAQISRYSHRPAERYSGVYYKQGRMVTDADQIEQTEILKGRDEALGDDAIGDGSPAERPLLAPQAAGGWRLQEGAESRAIERGLAWLNEQVERLDLRWSRVTDALDAVIDELPFFSLGPIRRHFGPIVRDVISFAGAVAGKLLEFAVHGALKLAGPFGERVWGVIQRAGAVIGLIVVRGPPRAAVQRARRRTRHLRYGARLRRHRLRGRPHRRQGLPHRAARRADSGHDRHERP